MHCWVGRGDCVRELSQHLPADIAALGFQGVIKRLFFLPEVTETNERIPVG